MSFNTLLNYTLIASFAGALISWLVLQVVKKKSS